MLSGAPGLQLAGGRLAFAVSEATEGMRDLNGDGDASDFVFHLYDLQESTVRSTGRAVHAAQGYRLVPGLAAWLVPEADEGAQDLNGDGDVDDLVLHVSRLR